MAAQRAATAGGPILVTGSTGYVGGRLVPRLLERGHRVRTLVRDLRRLHNRTWHDAVEVYVGNALRPEMIGPALQGVTTAYYLIHSMEGSAGFRAREDRAAHNFAVAARAARVKRIVYLGGLGEPDTKLSDHLRSRHRTGELLRTAGVPVTEFRAAMIIGSGSASFEMLRYLVEGLPVLLCPRWVESLVQPIAIRDVLSYLVTAHEEPLEESEVVEIGGADVLTYTDVLQRYADLRRLRRPVLKLPWMPPGLCAQWVEWLTPIPRNLAEPLIEGLRIEVVVRDPLAQELFPAIEPVGVDEAFLRALTYLQAGKVETTWRDAFATTGYEGSDLYGTTRQGLIAQRFEQDVDASAECTYSALLELGGEPGWGFRHPFWKLHQVIGRLTGSGQPARSRRNQESLREDDVVDGWRAVRLEPPGRMLLEAEGKVGGSAWIAIEVLSLAGRRARLYLTAYFVPHGFLGVLSWYLISPVRTVALRRLLRQIASIASAEDHGR
jgi:uncharacterized protein YbjT (DUF2867 family)